MACTFCQGLTDKPLKTPADLNQIIAVLQRASQKGVIQPVGKTYFAESFKALGHNSWNDTVSNYFTCKRCDQHFHLSAETYHGSGGAFKAVDALPDDMKPDGL